MITENLSTLKIHKLTQAQYERELEAGRIDPSAMYLTPADEETDPTVPAWAKEPAKPTYTASEVGADASGTASSLISTHNSDATAHADIRAELAIMTSEFGLINDKITALSNNKLNASELPEAVNTALAQAKASGEFDGDPGAPGVTPHIGTNGNWYIGSADTGVKAQGKDGTNGTSVTVKSVSESTADGGSNVVTFSDGNTITVKNGKTGTPGKTPVYGVDYGTPAQIEEIVQQVITALGTPIFGRVEDGNKIITTGNLASGTYEYWYEGENGKQVLIGTLEHDADAPNYTNQIPISTDVDGSIFNGTGYKESARLNSNCAVAEITNNPTNPAFVTGFIPIKQGDVIRLKNCYIDTKSYDSTTIYGNKTWALALCFYNSSFAWVDRCYWSEVSAGDKVSAVIGSDNLSTEFTVTCAKADIVYIRLTLAGTPGTAVVTVNEEIA